MRRSRTPWLRGVLTLAVLGTFGAAALITNAGAVAERREASKKFVRQQVKNKIAKSETQILNQTIAEDELIRFSRQVNQNGTEHTLATVGPFTFIGHCDDDGANFDASIEIRTTEANSAADTSEVEENDFDPSDPEGPINWVELLDVPDGDPTEQTDSDNYMRVHSPSGTYLQGHGHLLTNFDGFDCTFAGTIVQVAPVS